MKPWVFIILKKKHTVNLHCPFLNFMIDKKTTSVLKKAWATITPFNRGFLFC